MRGRLLKAAGVQFNPEISLKDENVKRCVKMIEEAAENEARLIVFPECAITGYAFDSRAEVELYAESIPGPLTGTVTSPCRKLNVFVILGLVEQVGRQLFNVAVFIGPDGLIGKYRKIHLPYQGLDRFVDHGDEPFKVYRTDLGSIGVNICYDSFFPESSRVLSLMGAELVALPTNWAQGVQFYSDHLIQTRALENHVNYIAVNRIGAEKGFTFYGRSKIIDYAGKVLAEASSGKEEIIYADIDLPAARNKRVVRIPGEWEVDLNRDRRPSFYHLIAEE